MPAPPRHDRDSESSPPSAQGAEAGERVVLGRVIGAHGLRGELRVRVFGDDDANLARAERVWLGAERDDARAVAHRVLGVGAGRQGELRLALEDVSDRDAAEALRGRLVLGDPGQLAPLEDGEFYWHELVGCEVVSTGGERVGTVREIWDTGAADVLVVEAPDGRRHLLSAARELVPEVDLGARRVVVELLPGMLDPEEAL